MQWPPQKIKPNFKDGNIFKFIFPSFQVLGNIDETMYQESIYYTPIQRTSYYEVLITDIQVNGTSLGLDCKEVNTFFLKYLL